MKQEDVDQIIEALRLHAIALGFGESLKPCRPVEVRGKPRGETVVPPGFVIADVLGIGKDIEVEDDIGEVIIFCPKSHWHLDHPTHIEYGKEILSQLLSEHKPDG